MRHFEMKKNTILITAAAVAASILLSGCVPPPPPVTNVLGGSRADGTVKIGYILNTDPNYFKGSFADADQKAAKACKGWGYAGAEAFDDGVVMNVCQRRHEYLGCIEGVQSRSYQCTGNNPGAVHK